MSNVLPKRVLAGHDKPAIRVSPILLETAALDVAEVYARLATRAEGLTSDEAAARLAEHGPNVLAQRRAPELRAAALARGAQPARDPAARCWRPSRSRPAIRAPATVMVADDRAQRRPASSIQEAKAGQRRREAQGDDLGPRDRAARRPAARGRRSSQLVPGDVVQLAAGDMIPGDVRIVQAKDLFVIQGSLTGESFPVEKFAVETDGRAAAPLELADDRVPRHERRERRGDGGRRRDRASETYLGGMAASLVGAAAADRVRPRHRAVHLADAPLHGS